MPIDVSEHTAFTAAIDRSHWDALRSRIAQPLIGTPAFRDQSMTQCTNAAQQAESGRARANRQLIARSIEIMTTTPFAMHTIADLAKVAGMSRSSFSRHFALIFGTSPLDFLKAERLRFAANLLCTSSTPIKMIAGMIGYTSVSYFSRAFRSEFDMPPTRARELAAMELPLDSHGNRGPKEAALSAWDLGDLKSAYDRLKLIYDATHDVVWDIDLTTGQVWWSEGMLQVLGYGPEQIGPDTKWCHEHIHPYDRGRIIDGMQKACANGDTLWRDELRYRKANGDYAHVLKRGVIFRDAVGEAVRFMGVMQEIAHPSRLSSEAQPGSAKPPQEAVAQGTADESGLNTDIDRS